MTIKDKYPAAAIKKLAFILNAFLRVGISMLCKVLLMLLLIHSD
jgi:hypothetical protein